MIIPNYIHHSKKEQKRTLKPQAIRSAKKRTKALIKQLKSQLFIHNHEHDQGLTMKYHVTLASGRDFILNSGYEVWQAAYDAYEAACEHDDYLVDVVPIDD